MQSQNYPFGASFICRLVAGTISAEITEVDASVHEIAGSSTRVNQNAEELSALAANLRQRVDRFKI